MAILVYETGTGFLQSLEFDCTPKETHSGVSEPTIHAVEEGADITEHVHSRPRQLQLEAVITNTPIRPSIDVVLGASPFEPHVVEPYVEVLNFKATRVLAPTQFYGGEPAAWKFPGQPRPFVPVRIVPAVVTQEAPSVLTVNGVGTRYDPDHFRKVYAELDRMRREATICTVFTDLVQGYNSMIITDLSAPKEAMDAVVVSVKMQEIRFATSSKFAPAQVKVTKGPTKKSDVPEAPTFEEGSKALTESEKAGVLRKLFEQTGIL